MQGHRMQGHMQGVQGKTFLASVGDGTQNFVCVRLYHVAMPLALLGKGTWMKGALGEEWVH